MLKFVHYKLNMFKLTEVNLVQMNVSFQSVLSISYFLENEGVYCSYFSHMLLLTLISLTSCLMTGCLGGGQINPLPFFLMMIQIYNILYLFGKPLSSTTMQKKLQKSKYLLQYLVIKKKCANKNAHIATNDSILQGV